MSGGLREGGAFGDYRVVRRLGKGGMGEVWLLQSASGGLVAAKILDSTDHEARRRFLREAEFALGVKHPNLVETYDVGEDPDTGLCYILMEYVPGGTLSDYLKTNGAMPVDDAVAVVRAMADILELGRQKGIVHRDIKPANIMFDAEGTPKLADLGIARGGIGGGMNTTTVTQTGMMIGTPAYMSPEQMLDAHHVDTRADIYSLGVVFFEMLTGERPNKDDTIVQLMAKAVKGEPLPDVRTLRPEVSASLAQLLNMMVAPDKDGRISTPGQITNALAIIERGGKFEQTEATKKDKAKSPYVPQAVETKKGVSWKALIPVGLLAGLAAAFWLLAPKQEQEARHSVVTNTIERVVEKKSIVTNAVQNQNGMRENPIKKVKDGKYTCETPEGEWTYHVRDGKAWLGGDDKLALFPKPVGKLRLPTSLGGASIIGIDHRAFLNCKELQEVEIPEGYEVIYSHAFHGCTALAKATLPETIRDIGNCAFCDSKLSSLDLHRIQDWDETAIRGLYGLEEIRFDSRNREFVDIGGMILDKGKTRLLFVPRNRSAWKIPASVKQIEGSACNGCAIRELVVPKGVRYVGHISFSNCGQLRKLQFESGDTQLRDQCFRWTTNLVEVIFAEGLKHLDEWRVFWHCTSLRELNLPDSLETMGAGTFEDNTSLEHVRFGRSFRRIGYRSFAGDAALKEVRLPQSLREMCAECFKDCHSLRKVYFDGDAPELLDNEEHQRGVDIFMGTPRDLVVYVKRGSKGWNPNGEGLPDRWPVGAGGNARAIRYADGKPETDGPEGAKQKTAMSMKGNASKQKWLVGQDEIKPIPAMRICIDQSHGGAINEDCAFYLPILSNVQGFAHKPCWYGLADEDLSHINALVLPPSHNDIPYLPEERTAIRSFMEKGGTVFAIVDGNERNLSMSRDFLSEYGISAVGRGVARDDGECFKGKVMCPAFADIRNIECVPSCVAEVSSEKDAAAWTALVADEEGYPVFACRSVGKGYLVFVSAGLCFSTEKMRDHPGTCRLWKRLFMSAAKERRFSQKAALHVRGVLMAPCRTPVGPITLHYAERWKNDVRTIIGYLGKALPALKEMGIPEIMSEQVSFSNVALLGTGTMHWYWTGGKRQMVGIQWGGFPNRAGPLIGILVENMLNGAVWSSDEIPLRRYLSALCLNKIGLNDEFERIAAQEWGDDMSGRYCRAFEAIRKDCPGFPTAFCREWMKMPKGTPSITFFAVLSKSISRDCRPYFVQAGVVAFGLEEKEKLAFSDREIDKMKGQKGDKAAQKAFDRLFPGWRVSGCGGVADESRDRIGYISELCGRCNLCGTLPRDGRNPVRFKKNVVVSTDNPMLSFSVRKAPHAAEAGFTLDVFIAGKVVGEYRIDDDDWVDETLDLSQWKGKKIQLEVRQSKLPELKNARAIWSRLEVQ